MSQKIEKSEIAGLQESLANKNLAVNNSDDQNPRQIQNILKDLRECFGKSLEILNLGHNLQRSVNLLKRLMSENNPDLDGFKSAYQSLTGNKEKIELIASKILDTDVFQKVQELYAELYLRIQTLETEKTRITQTDRAAIFTGDENSNYITHVERTIAARVARDEREACAGK